MFTTAMLYSYSLAVYVTTYPHRKLRLSVGRMVGQIPRFFLAGLCDMPRIIPNILREIGYSKLDVFDEITNCPCKRDNVF